MLIGVHLEAISYMLMHMPNLDTLVICNEMVLAFFFTILKIIKFLAPIIFI